MQICRNDHKIDKLIVNDSKLLTYKEKYDMDKAVVQYKSRKRFKQNHRRFMNYVNSSIASVSGNKA